MEITNELPKVPGFYWIYPRTGNPAILVEVVPAENNPDIFVYRKVPVYPFDSDGWRQIEQVSLYSKWYGPLEPPSIS